MEWHCRTSAEYCGFVDPVLREAAKIYLHEQYTKDAPRLLKREENTIRIVQLS